MPKFFNLHVEIEKSFYDRYPRFASVFTSVFQTEINAPRECAVFALFYVNGAPGDFFLESDC